MATGTPRRRILIAENNGVFQAIFKAILEMNQGYEIEIATDPLFKEAIWRFRPHLIVADTKDFLSDLFCEIEPLQKQGVVYIIGTFYDPKPDSSETTIKAFKLFRLIDAFNKAYFNPTVFLSTVSSAFTDKVKINHDLRIKFDNGLSFEVLSKKFVGRTLRESKRRPTQSELHEEIQELLQKIYYGASEIIISNLLSSPSGDTEVVLVESFSRGRNSPQSSVVKLGEFARIHQEFENFKTCVKDLLKEGRYPASSQLFRTINFGGIVHTFIDDECQSFARYYLQESPPYHNILDVVADIFCKLCEPWYKDVVEDNNGVCKVYIDHLGLHAEKLRGILSEEFAENFVDNDRVRFSELEGTLPNPVHLLQAQPMKVMAHICTTHGDLSGKHILVDRFNEAWLIDFYHTGASHIFRDFVRLETTIKFDLADIRDLLELYRLEHGLLWSTDLFVGNPELEKAYAVITEIRRLASQKLTLGSNGLREYYMGLLCYALSIFQDKRRDRIKRLYALLSAALICERLEAMRVADTELGSSSKEDRQDMQKGSLPRNLLSAVASRKAILFVGSGMSREGGLPSGKQLTEILAEEIGHKLEPTTNLARIAQYVQDEPGFGRGRLIDLLREKLDGGRVATSHRLVPRFPWAAVYTTNYDTLLEEGYRAEGGRYRKVLYSSALRNIPAGTTPIVKIHGCIEYGDGPDVRLIVTEDDYTEFEQHRKGLIAELKHFLFRGSPIVFVGYGLADDNLWDIYDYVRKELGDHLQYSYAVMPEASEREQRRLENKQIVLLPYTAEEFFLTLAEQLGVSTIV